MRLGADDLVRTILGLRVEGRQGKGRPKLTWEQVIQADVIACIVDPILPLAG